MSRLDDLRHNLRIYTTERDLVYQEFVGSTRQTQRKRLINRRSELERLIEEANKCIEAEQRLMLARLQQQ